MASYSTINERYIQDIGDEDDDITAVSSSPSSSFKQSTQFTLTYELVIPTESSLTEKAIDSFPLTLIADRFLSLVDMLHFITDDYTVKIRLKDNVTFSNGKKVTGQAVKACLDDLLKKNDRAPEDLKIDSINLNAFDNVDLSSFRDTFKLREITFRHETVMGFISEDQLAVDYRDTVLERSDSLSKFVGGSRLSEFCERRVADDAGDLIERDALVGRVGLVVYDDELTEVVGAVRATDFSCSSNCR